MQDCTCARYSLIVSWELQVTSQAAAQSEIVRRSALGSWGRSKGAVHNDIQSCIISKQADRTFNVFDYIVDVNEK